uniref:CSON000812 protein n=1 Tax=Culicoides sonorensis TaxID=179676 RepID=A0A336MFU6_CULSO
MKLFVIVSSFSVILISAAFADFTPSCDRYFNLEYDESNEVKSGKILLNVTSKLTNPGFTLEAIFGTDRLPIREGDSPVLELQEEPDKIEQNDILTYVIKYNLQYPVPKLEKIVIREIFRNQLRVCDDSRNYTHRIHMSAFHHIDSIGRRMGWTKPVYKLISRNDWGAQNFTKSHEPLEKPVKFISLMYTNTANCTTENECKEAMKSIQSNSRRNGFDDVPYNYLIGDDLNIYEGMGIEWQGNHTQGRNHESLGVAWIGERGNSSKPNRILVLQSFLSDIMDRNWLSMEYKLYPKEVLEQTI